MPSPSLYEIVYGPRKDRTDVYDVPLLDRALIANVVMARACALVRDTHGEGLHHQEINKLLDLREADGERTAP